MPFSLVAGVYAVKGRKEAPKKTPTEKIEMLSQTRKFNAEPPNYSYSTVQPEQTEEKTGLKVR